MSLTVVDAASATTSDWVTDVLVIGSGAGGATAAALIAESGRDVLVIEEGPPVAQGEVVPFSLEQMTRQYRNAGVTAAIGRPSIAYTEGCCVGGSTEINSALFRRPPAALIDRWRTQYGIVDLDPDEIDAICDELEVALSVGLLPTAAPAPSAVLRDGAAALGWAHDESPRWMRYAPTAPTGPTSAASATPAGRRQSMSETYLPRTVAAGGRIIAGARVERLVISDGRARAAIVRRTGAPGSPATDPTGRDTVTVGFNDVVVAAGAIHTPALLQRSGRRRDVGRRLAIHPTVKLVAEFPDPVNVPDDVPVHQVKEFAPALSFGGSASGAGLLALGLGDDWPRFGAAIERREHLAAYYAAITSEGRGTVRAIPGWRDPLVTYRLTARDRALLQRGLSRLTLVMLAAGATAVYPGVRGAPVVRRRADLAALAGNFAAARASVMTVHLCSTAPMGTGPGAVTDSFGMLGGTSNVLVSDASLLPEAPGVNPQASVMAFAIRNVRRFLDRSPRAPATQAVAGRSLAGAPPRAPSGRRTDDQ